MSRKTFSGLLDISADCEDCSWKSNARNALGSAAQHSDKYGHFVRVEQTIGVAYGPEGHPKIVERQKAADARKAEKAK